MIEIKKDNKLLNVFDNIDDYTRFLNDKSLIKIERKKTSETGDYSFTGTHSYEEALDLFMHGDQDTFNYIKKEQRKMKVEKLLGNSVCKKKTFNDLVGYQPNVPLYLNGVPTNMINEYKTKKDLKIINIFLDVCASAYVSTNSIRKAGTIYATMIDILEKQGYRTNLYIGDFSELYGEIIACCVRVKTDREPLNLNKLAFAIANPSMLRRIGFKYIEICNSDNDFTHSGYGRPYTNEEQIKNILDTRLKSNFIVFSYQDGLNFTIENILKRLEEKGIKLEVEYENKM